MGRSQNARPWKAAQMPASMARPQAIWTVLVPAGSRSVPAGTQRPKRRPSRSGLGGSRPMPRCRSPPEVHSPWRFASPRSRTTARARSIPPPRPRPASTATTSTATRRCSPRRPQLEDVHARYAARTKLVEAALRAGRDATARASPAIYLAAARATVALLEDEPREPVLLNYAGVLLLRAVERSTRPRRCSPPRSGSTPSWPTSSATSTRSRAARKAAARRAFPRAVAVALSELGQRAERVAAAAPARRGPAPQPLHDRQGRGGDAAALPRRRARPPSTRS